MFNAVRACLEKNAPEIVKYLNNPGEFWPNLRDNRLRNFDLRRTVETFEGLGRAQEPPCVAARKILEARESGEVPDPG